MESQDVTLKIPSVLYEATHRLAEELDITVGQVMRNALSNEIRRLTRNAKTPNRADEQLLAPLRALLATDLGQAIGWSDLMDRLKRHGFELREAGGGLALHNCSDGQRLCKASELGHAYSALMRRFGRPFPGHSHRHLAKKYLGQHFERVEDEAESDFDLIEPFTPS